MSRDIIIESDLGHDPDDFFAINYLIASGQKLRAILISPGDPDQVAIAKFICKENDLDIPIGVSKQDRSKLSSGSIHHDLLKKYKYPLEQKSNGLGVNILESVIREYPESELFIIGPVSSVGRYLEKFPETSFKRATMQGGFLPYSLHMPANPHQDFMGKEWMPTFNLNGDRPAGMRFLSANISERRIVGKNICHTVKFDSTRQAQPKNRAGELFVEAAKMYFERHESKKFHDPTAAACHIHPEIGTWIRGNAVKQESGWTTHLNDSGDYILADIDYDRLWECLLKFK